MNESLINFDNSNPTPDGDYLWVHDKCYFDYSKIKPEVDGNYEVLFDVDSSFRKLVNKRIMIPIFKYSVIGGMWYILSVTGHIVEEVPYDEKIIGWRAIDN